MTLFLHLLLFEVFISRRVLVMSHYLLGTWHYWQILQKMYFQSFKLKFPNSSSTWFKLSLSLGKQWAIENEPYFIFTLPHSFILESNKPVFCSENFILFKNDYLIFDTVSSFCGTLRSDGGKLLSLMTSRTK